LKKNKEICYLRVEDVQNGSAVGNAVEQHGESDGADHNDASVLGAVHFVRSGVAAVLRRRQQSIPERLRKNSSFREVTKPHKK